MTKDNDIAFYRTELRVLQNKYNNEEFLQTVAEIISNLNEAKEKAESDLCRAEHHLREIKND